MKHKVKRLLAAVLASALAISMAAMLFVGSKPARAVTSLPHIETIVSELQGGATFEILEIVPEAGTGSIGYYISGEEPSSAWQKDLGAMNAPEARAEHMNARLAQLIEAGLLGNDDNTPLRSAGAYQEAFPWARTGAGYTPLQLDHAEKQEVIGTFTRKAEGVQSAAGYDYTQQSSYQITQNGKYAQKINRFIPSSEQEDGGIYFYYSPTFTRLEEADAESRAENIAVYTNSATEDDADAPPSSGEYVYYGHLWDGLEIGKVYYYVSQTGAPSAMQGTHPYKARLDETDPYAEAGEDGHFNLTVTGYTYVGDGRGIYQFSKAATGDTIPITYDTVFYTGGYVNNHWFARKVFDREANQLEGIDIHVTSVSPEQMAEGLPGKIADGAYQLIVLSNGFLPEGTPASYRANSNDISQAVSGAISQAAAQHMPVMVDNALTGSLQTNIGQLADGLKSIKTSDAYVRDNIYFFDTQLVSSTFGETFEESTYKPVRSPYYDVYYEIYHENFLRKNEGASDDLLDERVSMAACVRYIINFSQQRKVSTKSAITVLDIEPIGHAPRNGVSVPKLGKAEVLSWLPSEVDASDITIVTMTTAEFIGRIEDVSETYDIVYFGPTGYDSSHYTYNDELMNGLVYTNIGDTFRARNMSGLLDRDYVSEHTFSLNGTQQPYLDATSDSKADLYRFSGNDLTAVKAEKLRDFARSGYPIIVSDTLMSNDTEINEGVVDSASQIYGLLNEIGKWDNVMRAGAAKNNQALVYEYLNLSKPEILFADGGRPTRYSETALGKGSLLPENGIYTLHYRFQILNATDATPLETTYQAELYLDYDGNGNYTQSEQLTDIRCELVSEDGSRAYVEPDALKAGTGAGNAPTYVITRQLPDDISGILPWKLKIIKNDNEHIHTSEIDYAYIRPEKAKKLNILQINTVNDAGGYNLEHSTARGGGNSYNGYNGIYGQLLNEVKDDFDVNIYTIYTNDMVELLKKEVGNWSTYLNSRTSKTINSRTTKVGVYLYEQQFFERIQEMDRKEALSDLLQQFDMVIIGFGDTYRDFDENTAPAVLDYINSGKSILFSHDTTSFYNVPNGYQQMVEKPKDSTIVLNQWSFSASQGSTTGTNQSNRNAPRVTYRSESYRSNRNTRHRVTGSVSQSIRLDTGRYTLTVTQRRTGPQGSTERLRFGGQASSLQNGSATITLNVPQTGTYNIGMEYILNNQSSSFATTLDYEVSLTKTVEQQVSGAESGWGYYFNTVLRSRVGLDRYGVVSDTATIRNAVKSAKTGGNMAQEIEDAGYTVAYQPKGGGKQTVPEAQGITSFELLRYGKNGQSPGAYGLSGRNGSNFYPATKISQVNQGQITTYPYNLNTKQFDPGVSRTDHLAVSQTHEQYYQLNMNAEDIVVWYCLAGGDYNRSPNDVVNSYYIYTVGNVTYTGAGHTSTTTEVSNMEDEARLFVNTMFAAYRPARSAPSIEAVEPSDPSKPAAHYYVTADYSGSGYSDTLIEQGTNYPIYFVVTDANLDTDRRTEITLSYGIGGQTKEYKDLAIYRAPAASGASQVNNIVSGIPYYFNLPDEVLQDFASVQNSSELILKIEVSTVFSSGERQTGNTSLHLLKVGLLNLA